MTRTLLQGTRLVQDDCITACDILIHDDKIAAILPPNAAVQADAVYPLQGLFVSAGFLDMHVHGGGGHDFMDGTEAAYHGVAALHLQHGTTALLPTTLAGSTQELLRSFAVYERCKGGFPDGAKLLGLHLEGPYLAPSQCGAQDPRFLRNPDPAEYEALLAACPDILRWTIAPELSGADALGRTLSRQGILPSIGHSDATSDTVETAMAWGYRHITHLYSAMSSIVRTGGFRRAGIVESAYLYPALTSEVIADGCHLPASLLRLAYRQIGPRRLALVTDAMRAAGQTQGESVLGSLQNGQRVLIEDGVAKMPDRSAFAGSICTADRLVRTMVTIAGASLPDAVRMITKTPAEILGLDHLYGSVLPDRAADLVVFDHNISVVMVLKDGIVCVNNQKEVLV